MAKMNGQMVKNLVSKIKSRMTCIKMATSRMVTTITCQVVEGTAIISEEEEVTSTTRVSISMMVTQDSSIRTPKDKTHSIKAPSTSNTTSTANSRPTTTIDSKPSPMKTSHSVMTR